jgi:secreted trypsin-like serine protease
MGRLLIFFALSSVAWAGTIEDGIPDARYRAYGATFRAYTCRLAGFNTAGNPQSGTCTVISPHWALTAAHVVHDLTWAGVLSDAGYHRVDRIFVHRDYADVFAEHDIALVHVVKPFELAKFPPLTDGTEQLGSVVTAAGYGVTGRLSNGFTTGDSELRAGTMRLTSRERSVYVCEIRRGGSPLPFCIAPGDSGGGLWGTASDGRTVLIGVNSYTAKLGTGKVRSRVGEESGHTRVELYREWIADIAGPLDTPCNLAGCQPR